MMRILILLIGFLIIASCMPATTVRTLDTRPSIAIQGAPEGSMLYIDGQKIGMANDYNGQPKTLIIEPGTHTISIKTENGKITHSQTIFVESEFKTIIVSH